MPQSTDPTSSPAKPASPSAVSRDLEAGEQHPEPRDETHDSVGPEGQLLNPAEHAKHHAAERAKAEPAKS